ncbi:glycosyltransferase family 2 protein [Palleronia rufa]|uniref:glycosyltransferase family 2 protein n=1 Tax=Palleronia rufa TaxID=1530186 RepID=UPI000689DE90|nr:glycosyltransferase family 2 protein [Palleronia rufa]
MAERILVVTAVRDEGPNLVHWIAHNRAAGVDAHLVFSNDCADGTAELLDRLAPAGVTHLRNRVPQGRTPQWAALKQAARHPETTRADWIMVLDCDEYLNLRPPLTSVPDLIARARADAVVLPWRLFGSSGHADRPDPPPTRAFTRAIAPDALFPPLSRFFKTLYRRAAFRAPGVHRPKPGPIAADWADGSGARLPRAFAQGRQIMQWGAPLATDLVQLNHYSVRSAAEFTAKAARGLPNHTAKPVDLAYWVERNFNTVEDTSILAMEPATQSVAAWLRALPGVAEIEDESRAWHRSRFAAALTDPDMLKLYGRLLMAPGSHAPDRDTALRLVDLYGRCTGQGAP